MCELARIITGLNEDQIRETEYRSVRSVADVESTSGVPARQSVRFSIRRMVGNADFDEARQKLAKRPIRILLKP
ncbi:MAG: hypothetical protein WCJ56_13550 [bacterium]